MDAIQVALIRIAVLEKALTEMVAQAQEAYPHFESPRGQANIAAALEALTPQP